MTCSGCGHNFSNTLTRCPRCKLRSNRASQRSSDSRLIEFPRKARAATENESPRAALPAWRSELSEKVRAIRARRNNPALQTESTINAQASQAEAIPDVRASTLHDPEPPAKTYLPPTRAAHTTPRDSVKRTAVRAAEYALPEDQSESAPKTNQMIVEKALTRVRRASENASRATLPKIEPARPVAQNPSASLMRDKEATARALEPTPEVNHQDFLATQPLPEIESRPIKKPEAAPRTMPLTQSRVADYSPEIERTAVASVEPLDELPELTPLDEIEPLDYLEAEVRKVDRALRSEHSPANTPPLFTHLVIHTIDLLAIAVCALPFIALIGIYNGSYAHSHTRAAAIGVSVLVALLYFGVTQCLCGKTFGMMLTNAHVADARTLEPVTPSRAILRSFSYVIAIAPVMIGLLWAAINRRRRGWHDYLSGTQVVPDF